MTVSRRQFLKLTSGTLIGIAIARKSLAAILSDVPKAGNCSFDRILRKYAELPEPSQIQTIQGNEQWAILTPTSFVPPKHGLPKPLIPRWLLPRWLGGRCQDENPLPWPLWIVRPQDFLSLWVDAWSCDEQQYEQDWESPILATRGTTLLRVTFPPQHIAEGSVEPKAIPNGNKCLGSCTPNEFAGTDYPSRLAGLSRLVFELQPNSRIRLTIAELLNWSNLALHVNRRARRTVTEKLRVEDIHQLETAIEFPYRLLLSPNEESIWKHSFLPDIRNGWTEVWHTRLESKRESPDNATANIEKPPLTMRALFNRAPQGTEKEVDWTLPKPQHRQDIVELSSDFGAKSSKGGLYKPKAVAVNELTLSTIGATALLHGQWNPSDKVGCANVDEWVQDTWWGRDEFVLVSHKGYVLPFGHYVSYVETVRRELVETPIRGVSRRAVVLRKRRYVQVREPRKEYPDWNDGENQLGRQMPFREVRITPPRTPDLCPPIDILHCDETTDDPSAFWMIPEGQTEPFQFTITTKDWDGRVAEFTLPLVYVNRSYAEENQVLSCNRGAAQNPAKVFEDIASKYLDAIHRTAQLSGQAVAFVPKNRAQGKNAIGVNQDNFFEVRSITFGVETSTKHDLGNTAAPFPPDWTLLRFYPTVKEAKISIPAVAQFQSTTAAESTVVWNETYLKYGLPRGNSLVVQNQAELFVNLRDPQKFDFPGSKSGGVAKPSLSITSLSRLTGPAGESGEAFAKGIMTANAFFPEDAKLIGGILFREIVEDITDRFEEALKETRIPTLVLEKITQLETSIAAAGQTIQTIEGLISSLRGNLEALKQSLEPLAKKFNDDLNAIREAIENKKYQELQGIWQTIERDAGYSKRVLEKLKVPGPPHAGGRYVASSGMVHTVAQLQGDPGKDVASAWAPSEHIRKDLSELHNTLKMTIGNLSEGKDSAVVKAKSLKGDIEQLLSRLTQVPHPPRDPKPEDLRVFARQLQSVLEDVRSTLEDTKTKTNFIQEDELRRWRDAAHTLSESIKNFQAQTQSNVGQLKTNILTLSEQYKAHLEETFRAELKEFYEKTMAHSLQQLSEFERHITGNLLRLEGVLAQPMARLNGKIAQVIDPIQQLLRLDKQTLRYEWHPKLKAGSNNSAFNLVNTAPGKNHCTMSAQFHTSLTNPKDSSYTLSAEIIDFRISIPASPKILSIQINRVSVISHAGQSPQLDIQIGKVSFDGALAFIAELAKSFAKRYGLELEITDQSLAGKFQFALPSISVGVFSLSNLRFVITVLLKFNGDPAVVRFAIAERNQPFLLSVGLLVGGGFLALEATPQQITRVEMALEFGAMILLNIDVAYGVVSIRGGVYYSREKKDGKDVAILSGYVRAVGALRIIGLITLRVEFLLSLTYEPSNNTVWGEVTVVVEIELLFFSVSVALTVRKVFQGSSKQDSEHAFSPSNEILYASAGLDDGAITASRSALTGNQPGTDGSNAQHCESIPQPEFAAVMTEETWEEYLYGFKEEFVQS